VASPEYNRAYREAHRDELCRKDRERHAANPDRGRAQSRAYRETHAEHVANYQARYRAEHPGKNRLYLAARRATEPFRITAIQAVAAIRFRTRQSGAPRDDSLVTVIRLTELFRGSPACAMCGSDLDYGPKGRGRGRQCRDNSPSLDRFVPALGYVEGNIDVLCRLCNTRKNNHTLESAKLLVEYLSRRGAKTR
jgi:hypothetical protein